MTAGTSGDVQNLDIEEVGLSPAHAYTVLKVFEIGREKIVRLRNPWGNGEYSGAWSDSSSKWTKDLKRKYGVENKNDGVFHMSFDDFLKYYYTMGFAKIYEYNKTRAVIVKTNEAVKCQLIRVTVNKNNMLVYLNLYQKNPRIILKDGTYQKTVLSFLMLVDQNFNYVDSVSSKDMHICIEKKLNSGTYYLFCDVNYRYANENHTNHNYNVTSYAPDDVKLENITAYTKNLPELFQNALYSFAKTNGKLMQRSNCNIYTYSSFNKKLPFVLAVYENTGSGNIRSSTSITYKGGQSGCVYCDDIYSEKDTKIVKDLRPNNKNVVAIMRYTLSSLISFSVGISN